VLAKAIASELEAENMDEIAEDAHMMLSVFTFEKRRQSEAEPLKHVHPQVPDGGRSNPGRVRGRNRRSRVSLYVGARRYASAHLSYA